MINEKSNETNWNRDDGYKSNVIENRDYPHRTFSADTFDTLRVNLKLFFENEHICPNADQGFRISFHSPDELPRVTIDSVRIPIDQQLFISLDPKIVTTSEALRNYSPENRGCFFQTDRKLRFFKTYNQRNCGFECLANYTMEQCGCVAFWMPGQFSNIKFYSKTFLIIKKYTKS